MPATFLKSLTKLEDLPKGNKPHVAMIGRSNVGKSSLINALANQKALANTSSEPGRTQTINLFDINNRFFLVDLPGYGFAKASKVKRVVFTDMIHDYLWQAPNLKLVLLIVDVSIPPTDLDREMFAFLQSARIPVAMILNKADKLSNTQLTNALQEFESTYPNTPLIAHSNVTGKGRGEILHAIDQAVRSSETNTTV